MQVTNRRQYYTFNQPRASFTGHVSVEKIGKNFQNVLIHETSFFREPKTNQKVVNYIFDTFAEEPEINIVSAACSTGEEALTLSMLLENLAHKVKILGFDISKKSIEEANSGTYKMQGYYNLDSEDAKVQLKSGGYQDIYLVSDVIDKLTPLQMKCKSLFNSYFKPSNKPVEEEKISVLKKVKTWVLNNLLDIETPKLESKYYELRPGKGKNCKFVQGDIMDIENILGEKKANVIYFRNALYHLISDEIYTYGQRELRADAPEIVTKIISKLENCLSSKGLIVFGEKEEFQVENYEIVPKIMKRFGFEALDNYGIENIWKRQF